MINFFVWKRKTPFFVHSLLILAYCLMVMSGGMLITNESHAQTCEITARPGDRVVVQNVNNLQVRSQPRIEEGNNFAEVNKGHKGIIKRDPKWNNEYAEIAKPYIWFYVEWEGVGKAGWSAGIREEHPKHDTIKWISTILERDQKDAIIKALFNGEDRDKPNHKYIHHDQTIHDYNDYGCNATWGKSYGYPDTGHAGWDVAASAGAVPFYSLTAGKLLLPNANGETDSSNTIAIYDEDSDMTILYLHARDILVKPDKDGMVHVGNKLGIQGNTSSFRIGVHVHIEIQKGESIDPVYKTRGNETISPIPCLYRWAIGARMEEFLPWDVNHDGQVDFTDYRDVFITWWKNEYQPQHDVNCDGIVNWADVAEVLNHLPAWFAPAARVSPAPLVDQTSLLPNYPNPFNPETWIPYSLAEDANVNLTIYNVKGTMVRHFDLGQQPAGHYIDRSKSIYWDGRNVLGEQVGSGVYLYHLQAGNYSATRRMVILK